MSNEDEQTPEQEQGHSSEQSTGVGEAPAGDPLNLGKIPSLAIQVVTNPVGFYQAMPKSGGFVEPLVFMVVLAVVAGILSAALSLFGLGMAGVMVGGLMAIIMIPIFVTIFGFVGAAIAYVVWKMMGSHEDFETAFRCVAYTAAISPVTAVLSVFPYLGSLASALWPMTLLAIASIHVHRRSKQTSWAVFGALGIILALINISGARTAQNMTESLEEMQRLMEQQ